MTAVLGTVEGTQRSQAECPGRWALISTDHPNPSWSTWENLSPSTVLQILPLMFSHGRFLVLVAS